MFDAPEWTDDTPTLTIYVDDGNTGEFEVPVDSTVFLDVYGLEDSDSDIFLYDCELGGDTDNVIVNGILSPSTYEGRDFCGFLLTIPEVITVPGEDAVENAGGDTLSLTVAANY